MGRIPSQLATHMPASAVRCAGNVVSALRPDAACTLQRLWFMHTADDHARTHTMAPADAQLRARIQQRLKDHGQVDPTKIGVVVRDGQVLLWGSVATAAERTLAGEVASGIADRTAVINHIQVFRSSQC